MKMKRVLLIEDDTAIAEPISLFLGRAGHRVKLAYDGQQGINFLMEKEGFDVVVTDIRLPKISGNVVARYIRDSFPRKSEIQVVAIAGYVDEVEKDLYDWVLVKPFNLRDLAQLVEAR